jgi:hypothetical protein
MADVASDADADEEDLSLPLHVVRTASVILPSGDRVRRKVSLISIDDEIPFEHHDSEDRSLLSDARSTAGTNYGSIASIDLERGIHSWVMSCFRKFRTCLRSEQLKR